MIQDYYRKRRRDAVFSAIVITYCALFGLIIILVALIYNLITGRG